MIAKNVNECWLDTNLDKGYIDTERHFAGVRLRGIYERTIPKTIISYTTDRIDRAELGLIIILDAYTL